MNTKELTKLVTRYLEKLQNDEINFQEDEQERNSRMKFYKSWTENRLLEIDENDFFEYLSKLWAMRVWGNKKYKVNKVIDDNGLEKLSKNLASLVWGNEEIVHRWDHFNENIKGIGIGMMSEILCHVHPTKYVLWNRRTLVGFNRLGVKSLPSYDYQVNGKKYKELSNIAISIKEELESQSGEEKTLLDVDYFIWRDLQTTDNLRQAALVNLEEVTDSSSKIKAVAKSLHNEIRDKIANIGGWLGFQAETETKVADGSIVDVVWEASISNIGRAIFVFEVQTKGNIDSLLINLLKSSNNQAVQGVVAVSDTDQLEKIRKHAKELEGLREKLIFWNYEDVFTVYDNFEIGFDLINGLKLVPEGMVK